MADIQSMEMGTISPTSNWIQRVAQEFWDSQDEQKHRRIPLAKLKQTLLETPKADRMPNAMVVDLLQKADLNNDGYIDYEEYMKFAESASKFPRRRDTFTKAALAVLPRNERTVAKRSYLHHYSCRPPPLFMILVSLIEIATFIYYRIDMMDKSTTIIQTLPLYSPLIFNPFRRYEAWRYITYAFVHSGYVHLIFNMIAQLILGIVLELMHGWWRVAIIYLTGVFFGSLAQSLMHPTIFVLGASGGVFAVEYAHVGNLLLNWSQMEFRWIQLTIIVVLSTTDVSLAVYDLYFKEIPSNTGHMGHLGGAIAGLTVGIYILRNFEKLRWEKYCWWVAVVIFFILMIVGIVLSAALPVPSYFPHDDTAPLGQAKIDYLNNNFEWASPPPKQ